MFTFSYLGRQALSPRQHLFQRITLALFVAILVLLAFTPLGYIPLVFVKATSLHLPVILGSLLLGPTAGLVLGFSFGLTSLINNSFNPSLLSACFSPFIPLPGAETGSWFALVVCFLPRLILGLLPALLLQLFYQSRQKKGLSLAQTPTWALAGVSALIAAVCTLLHTFLVLLFFQVGFAEAIAQLKGFATTAIPTYLFGLLMANGIPEAIVALILVGALFPILIRQKRLQALSKSGHHNV